MKNRNEPLDFVKGCLVIGMVLYHSMNYYFREIQVIRYISFITGAFILISGFLVSSVYLNREGVLINIVAKRLFTRGLKLILVFIILNIGTSLFLDRSHSSKEFSVTMMLENLYLIFVAGHTKLVAFDILLPISYLLVATSLIIIFVKEKYRFTSFLTLSILLLMVCTLQYIDNVDGYNLRYLTVGFCGVVFGFIPITALNENIQNNRTHILGLYAVILMIIMIYRLYYPLYVVYVLINILLLYVIGLHVRSENIMIRQIAQLGKHSLFSYIIQIAILQIIYKIFNLSSEWSQLFVSFVMTTVIMIATVNTLNLLQAKYTGVNKIYSLVFR